jgi:hypothetical protein
VPGAHKPDDPVSKPPSIRLKTDGDGRPLWDAPLQPGDPTRVWLESDSWSGYTFVLSYDAGGNLVGLHVHRMSDAAPLSAHLLQRVPLGKLDRAARRCVALFLDAWDRPKGVQSTGDIGDHLDRVADPRTLGDDERLAKLCRRYLELDGKSGWRAILAREFGYAPSSIQTIIGRARGRRFLTRVPRGQYGGDLTPKALRLLTSPKSRTDGTISLDEGRAKRLHDDLLKQHADGQVDDGTFGVRYLAIEALVSPWTPRELWPDHPALGEIERQLQIIKEQP